MLKISSTPIINWKWGKRATLSPKKQNKTANVVKIDDFLLRILSLAPLNNLLPPFYFLCWCSYWQWISAYSESDMCTWKWLLRFPMVTKPTKLRNYWFRFVFKVYTTNKRVGFVTSFCGKEVSIRPKNVTHSNKTSYKCQQIICQICWWWKCWNSNL